MQRAHRHAPTRWRTTTVAMVAASALVVAGCSGDEPTDTATDAATATGVGQQAADTQQPVDVAAVGKTQALLRMCDRADLTADEQALVDEGRAAAEQQDGALPKSGLEAIEAMCNDNVDQTAKHLIPNEWMLQQRLNADGELPAADIARADRQAQQVRDTTARGNPSLTEFEWESVGPDNIGGRIIDIAMDPNEPGLMYVAAATGGLWRSTDGGETLEPVWSESHAQTMGAVAVDGNGVVWAGTGEPNSFGTRYGDGIHRSTDRGETWQHMGLEDTGAIGRVRIDPQDPDTVYVAAQGRLISPDGRRGLFRTTDGGATWELVLEGGTDFTGVIDVAVNADDPDILLAATWEKRRDFATSNYAGASSGLHRSTDGGDTWQRLDAPAAAPADEAGRIAVAFAPGDGTRAYASVLSTNHTQIALLISDDAGATWEKSPDTTLNGATGGFGWWFGRVWVDPDDKDHVFHAGTTLSESHDGGQTWDTQFYWTAPIHVDQHGLAFDPHHENRVYAANDGGLYWNEDNGEIEGNWERTPALPISQFYAIDVSTQDPTKIIGGTQDNNSLNNFREDDWSVHKGGDGMYNRFNPDDDSEFIACSQNGNCQLFGAGRGGFRGVEGSSVNWVAPVEYAPSNPDVVYHGTNLLNRSDDGGKTFRAISGDLTNGTEANTLGSISVLGVAPGDEDVVYVGSDDGRVSVTFDAGETWETLDHDLLLPHRWVTRITVDPDDSRTAWVTYSGFKWDSDASPHVLMTTDGGQTFRDISGNLPEAPVNDIVRDPNHPRKLYVATDVGVFHSPNMGRRWLAFGEGIPNVIVADLVLHEDTRQLFAGTYGRSIYKAPIPG